MNFIMPSRRSFLMMAASPLVLAACGRSAEAQADASEVEIALFDDAGKSLGTKLLPKVVKTEAEWRAQLSPLAYKVTREAGTERAGTGPFLDEHRPGLFRCVCCDTALFDAATKYESGTGWPSFWQPISELNIVDHQDLSIGMIRTENVCALCDAHLGHVFNDGPDPTGLRYCMNGVALKFVPYA